MHVRPRAAGKIARVTEHSFANGSTCGQILCLHGNQWHSMALSLVPAEVLHVEVGASARGYLADVGFGGRFDRDRGEVLWGQAVADSHMPYQVLAVNVGLAALLVLAGKLLDELFAPLRVDRAQEVCRVGLIEAAAVAQQYGLVLHVTLHIPTKPLGDKWKHPGLFFAKSGQCLWTNLALDTDRSHLTF